MDLALTDATGSGADLVPVAIRKATPAAPPSPGHRPKAVDRSGKGVGGVAGGSG
jgi:hypothetical protein